MLAQTEMATTIHASVAAPSTAQLEWSGSHFQTSKAKASRPTVPMAVPAASTPAASLPRLAPCNPLRCFFRFSFFSSKVAAAGKIAGKARNNPPTCGPSFLAMIPVIAVIRPPKRNRIAYSQDFVRRTAARSRWIFMRGSAQPQQPNAKGRGRPHADQRGGGQERGRLVLHHDHADAIGIYEKCDGASDHRTGFERGIGFTVRGDHEAQAGQSNGRRRAK